MPARNVRSSVRADDTGDKRTSQKDSAVGDYSAALAVFGPKMRVGTGKPQEVPSVTLT
jgi:hypothetical protein